MSDEKIIRALADWIHRLGENYPPTDDITAFNFGIFQKTDESYRLYISGARVFDPNTDDWACETDYLPEGRYFEHVFDCDSNWELMLDHAIRLTTRYVESPEFKTSFLRSAQAITVGFDDGNLKRIL